MSNRDKHDHSRLTYIQQSAKQLSLLLDFRPNDLQPNSSERVRIVLSDIPDILWCLTVTVAYHQNLFQFQAALSIVARRYELYPKNESKSLTTRRELI